MAKGGAKFAIADRHGSNLAQFADQLRADGAEVFTKCLDARNDGDVMEFADATFAKYGGVDYYIYTAGMSSMGSIFRLPLSEWRMLFEMNVMGQVHGIRAFIPRMIEQNRECYVINTASNAGLETNAYLPAYFMSKHAAVSLSESLTIELQAIGSKVKAYVFCPGLVQTPLSYNSAEMRVEDPYYTSDEYQKLTQLGKNALANGMTMDEAMDRFFQGLEADNFYIRTHDNEEEQVRYRTEMVLNRTRPLPIPMRAK
jgi:NADP-dependent 3-hydroxy acid dehydrogenase YdfG